MALTASEIRRHTPTFGIELEMFGDPFHAVFEMNRNGFTPMSAQENGWERVGSCGYPLDDCPNGQEDEDGNWQSGEDLGQCCHCGDCYEDESGEYGLHAYHCRCPLCRYDRTDGLFAAQEDCSVDAEFVSRILSVENDRDMQEFARFDDFFPTLVERSSWHEPGAEAGNHIHVGKPTDWTNAHNGWINLLFGRFLDQFRFIAGAGVTIRSYNGSAYTESYMARQGVPDSGPVSNWSESSWLRTRRPTVEFRLWNSPNEKGYIPFHVNMSLALTRWASVMHDREPAATIGDAKRIVPKSWKRALRDVSLFMDHRVPGASRHEPMLMDLAAQA